MDTNYWKYRFAVFDGIKFFVSVASRILVCRIKTFTIRAPKSRYSSLQTYEMNEMK